MPASSIPYFVNRRTISPISAASVLHSSVEAGWSDEVVVERISSPPREWPEHAILGHRLLVNVGAPMLHACREGGRMREMIFAPGATDVLPHGTANRARWGRCDVVLIAVAPILLARLVDGCAPPPSEMLRPCRNVLDPILHDLVQRMVAELIVPTERSYGDALGRALALHVLRSYGRFEPRPTRLKARLSSAQARRAVEYMRSNFQTGVSVSEVAREVGLSDAHFARAFRATFGEPPHRLMLRWRLELALRLIAREGVRPSRPVRPVTGVDLVVLAVALAAGLSAQVNQGWPNYAAEQPSNVEQSDETAPDKPEQKRNHKQADKGSVKTGPKQKAAPWPRYELTPWPL